MTDIRFDPVPIPPVGEPLAVALIADEVVFIGSGAVAFSMTRPAAEETYHRLRKVLGLD